MHSVRVGLSGFSYKPWQGEGRFYPPELKAYQFLDFYAQRYTAVEMDGTWYRMPSEEGVAKWRDGTPAGFEFCPKMHRDVTHMRRLKPEAFDSAKFFLGRLKPLAEAGRLGPVLVQLPPNMKKDVERLDAFLSEFAAGNRLALEFRHESWNDDAVAETLHRHNAAFVASDTDEMDAVRRDTADFAYARLRKCDYSDDDLREWAAHFRGLGKPTWVFLKHEDEGSPWIWADALLGHLGSG